MRRRRVQSRETLSRSRLSSLRDEGDHRTLFGRKVLRRCTLHLCPCNCFVLRGKAEAVPPRAQDRLVGTERIRTTAVRRQLPQEMRLEVVLGLLELEVGDAVPS